MTDTSTPKLSIGTVHINLKGAGYSHVVGGDGTTIAVTYEGDKVLLGPNGLTTLDNVHVLGPVAVEEMKSAARADALREVLEAGDRENERRLNLAPRLRLPAMWSQLRSVIEALLEKETPT